jgi:hypothetical protein
MKADLKVVGFSQELPRRIAASTTRFYTGEPLHATGTFTSGVSSTNVFVPAAADTPVIGTHRFGGIAIKDALPAVTGTLVAHTTMSANPIPWVGRIRGRGETAADIDTDAEALGIIGDTALIDYAATGSPSSGPLYTVKTTATAADTSGLEIVEVSVARGTVDVVVDGRSYRHDVT